VAVFPGTGHGAQRHVDVKARPLTSTTEDYTLASPASPVLTAYHPGGTMSLPARLILIVGFWPMSSLSAPQPTDPYNQPCIIRWFQLERLEQDLMDAATRAIEAVEAGEDPTYWYNLANQIQTQIDETMPAYLDDCVNP
jgi:hypothetical protein